MTEEKTTPPTSTIDQMKDSETLMAVAEKYGYQLVPKGAENLQTETKKVVPTLDIDLSGDGDLSKADAKKMMQYLSEREAYIEGLIKEGEIKVDGKVAKVQEASLMDQVYKLRDQAVAAGMTIEDFESKVYPEMVQLHRQGQTVEATYQKACRAAGIEDSLDETKGTETQGKETKEPEKKPEKTPEKEVTSSGLKSNSGAPNSNELEPDMTGKTIE